MNICYLIPSTYICGGNRIIAEHCKGLQKKGHDVTIAVVELGDTKWLKKVSGHKIKVVDWFVFRNEVSDLDAIVATYFETYYDIKDIDHDLPTKCQKYYFVQQIESRFFDDDDESNQVRANKTYTDKSFKLITEAKWIVSDLQRRFNREATFIPNKQELPPNIPDIPKDTKKPIILVEGNASAYKKGVTDAWLAIKDLPYEKWLLTNSKGHEIPQQMEFDRVFSSVEWEVALGVIKTADVLLKPSHLEGSPTPHMEAMALGTPLVTTDCTGVYEYCVHEYNALIVPTGDGWKMRDAVQRLLNDKELSNKLIANGLKTAKQFDDWKPAIDKLAEMFELDVQFRDVK